MGMGLFRLCFVCALQQITKHLTGLVGQHEAVVQHHGIELALVPHRVIGAGAIGFDCPRAFG